MIRNKRLQLLAAMVLVLGGMGLVATATGGAPPSAVHLHLGSNGRYFQFGSTTQTLTTANNSCQVNSASPVMALTASGSQASPGLGADSIGVKSKSGANGTPCGQVDSSEGLILKPGTGISSRTFSGVRLDLEITGNAIVKLTLSKGATSAVYQLQTGTSIAAAQSGEPDYDTTVPYTVSSSPGDTTDACAAPNSSGPNSGPNDNCEWTVQPGFNFDTVALTTVSAGSVSLEGSNDFGNDPSFDSLFFLSNAAPTPTNDTVTTNEDTAASGNVLANDSDPDGNPLSASVVTSPVHGTLTLAANGAFTYTPAPDYNGADSFTYAASDGVVSTNANVGVTVTPVNDPPVARSGTATTNEDTAVTITIATDVDSTALTAHCTGAGGGSIVDHGDGTVTFTPATNFNGSVTLVCTATDDKGAGTATSATIVVGVTPVNDAPVAHDDTAEVNQNSNAAIPVLGNDSDVDGDPLSPTSIGGITPLGATAVANADGTVTYTPPVGYAGAGSFSYKASDGQLTSNAATVSVTVFPVICSNDTVTDSDGGVIGSFTRLDDSFNCKRYALDASNASGTILFKPTGAAMVDYRGFVSFGTGPAPTPGDPVLLGLNYDPAGGSAFQPVRWCVAPQFDGNDLVTSATIPAGETWCIANADTRGAPSGGLVTTYQVFGHDDPKFALR
ncbi:MAG: cadherin-like domain-containing protein [Acidimicrobiia bacterium]